MKLRQFLHQIHGVIFFFTKLFGAKPFDRLVTSPTRHFTNQQLTPHNKIGNISGPNVIKLFCP